MYEILFRSNFSSAHRLKGYQGKCEEMHGHNWKVEVSLFGEKIDRTGMLIDFKIAKKTMNEITSKLDHTILNNLKPFSSQNPTSENIACYIFQQLKTKGMPVKWVRIWETDDQAAVYRESR